MLFQTLMLAVGTVSAAAVNYNLVDFDPSIANVTEDTVRQLAARGDQCHDATGQSSQWANAGNDGNGRYVGTCGDTGHGKSHCWTDVYLTQAQVQWHPWMQASDNLQCHKGSPKNMCHINQLKQLQNCKSESDSVSISTGLTDGIINIGASYTHETTTQDCKTSSNTYTCDWDNSACHRIVATNKYVRYWGYVRRTCNTPRGNNGNPHPRGDGKYTVGWSDWQMDLPTADNLWQYSCKYHCETDLGSKAKDLPAAGPVIRI